MVNNSTDIVLGSIVYSMMTERKREKDKFLEESVLILQISGQLTLETSGQKISTKQGDMLLVRKHQLVKMTKMPLPGEDYKVVFMLLSEDILRKYALENRIEIGG